MCKNVLLIRPQQLGGGKTIVLLVQIEAQNAIKLHNFPKNHLCINIDSCLQLCEERDGGGDRALVLSPLVVDDGQQTFLP